MLANFANEIQFVGRLLLGGAFVVAGSRNAMNAGFLTGLMAAKNVPMPRTALWVGIFFQLLGAIGLVFGPYTMWAGLALILFIITATVIFHNFYGLQGPERVAEINAVISNTALVGGLLVIVATAM
ncbi:DoxX family membrane protein [Mesorhizobium sp. NBSH29]|uniref:DoxX family protein n=1 Tax=Mesorhizobium sp. NBSH29 TaxID=2654249 RepID=UPI001896651A|nr:DoxX family protein [Mesorhizobium sp. NBSH29]QPC88244.1 DoxX family membrane protein [Mesorhizobium sp. NBSH29]